MNTNRNKFLRRVMYTCLAIVPFLAFYVAGFGINAEWNAMLFPYITGKNFGFRILVEIAAAAWVMLMILDKSFRPKKSILLWLYSAFVFVLLLADIFSVNPVRSFLSNFERMEGFITHAHLFLYFLMLITLFKDKASWAKYKTVLFISNIPVLILALLQLLGLPNFGPMKYLSALRDAIHSKFSPSQGGLQLDASLGNSTYLAIYVIFFIFLFLISYLEERSKKAKNNWVYLVMVILNLVVLFYTQTRGAQVGFAIGMFVAAIIIFFGGRKYKELKRKRNLSLAIIVVAIVGYLGLVAFGNSSFIQNSSTLNRLSKVSIFANPITLPGKIGEIKNELYNPSSTYESLLAISGDGTFTSRLLNIKMSLEGFKERPILGWGQDNYFYVFAKYNDARMYAQEPWFDRSHNVFMDWLIAGGVLGLLAYLSLYVAAIWMMWSKKHGKNHNSSHDFTERALLTGLLIAYFVHNIFVFDNLISYILFFIVLAYISVRFNGKTDTAPHVRYDEKEAKRKRTLFGPIVLIFLALSLYFLNIQYIRANRHIINGLMPQMRADESPVDALNRSLESFKKAADIGGIAQMESREQLAQNTLNLLNQIQSSNLPNTEEYAPIYKLASDSIAQTKEEYTSLLEKRFDPRSLAIFSSFLRNVGDVEEYLIYGRQAHEYAPEKQSITMEYIQSLLSTGNYEEANRVAREMYDSDRSYDLSKAAVALTDMYVGNFDEAEQFLTVNGVMQVDESVVRAYQLAKQETRIINILKKNLEINPQDISSAVVLSQVYLDAGMKNSAIAVLNNLKKAIPEMATQIDEYIKSLN